MKAQSSPSKPKKTQEGPRRPKKAREGPEKAREGPRRPREGPEKAPGRLGEGPQGIVKPSEESLAALVPSSASFWI